MPVTPQGHRAQATTGAGTGCSAAPDARRCQDASDAGMGLPASAPTTASAPPTTAPRRPS